MRADILDREHGVRCGPKHGHFFSIERYPPRPPEGNIVNPTQLGP